jgi:chromosome segregation ATPase
VSDYIGEAEANAVPDSVMKQILSEVEIVTEEVIIKTRAESEAKIAELNGEIESLKVERDRSKKHAKYDLDDMTRVNRSLRDEIERNNEEKDAIEEELEAKCDEFDALNEDVERFAETFAEQHGECQQLEGQVRNLLLENENLTRTIANKKMVIGELEVRLEAKHDIGSEFGKLWNEVERLKSSSIASPPVKQVDNPYFTVNSSTSDISR